MSNEVVRREKTYTGDASAPKGDNPSATFTFDLNDVDLTPDQIDEIRNEAAKAALKAAARHLGKGQTAAPLDTFSTFNTFNTFTQTT